VETKKILKVVKELNVGGSPKNLRANLCIYNQNIDIPLLTKLAGHEPTKSHIKGEIIGRRPPASIGFWDLQAPAELSFPEKIAYLVQNTSSKKMAWDKIAENNKIQLRCAIFLHSWNEGFDIPADIIAEIGKRHWIFGMSIYSADGNEIIEAFLSKNKRKQRKSDLLKI
jgi:Domain of unknown function (DUF4279)